MKIPVTFVRDAFAEGDVAHLICAPYGNFASRGYRLFIDNSGDEPKLVVEEIK